jgi:general secretion pathway protein D
MTAHKHHHTALAIVLVIALSSLLPAVKAQQDEAMIKPNYREADIRQIVEAVSEVTGKNFVLDPRVKAQVTMLSATPMSADAFYETFLSILQVHGFVAVPSGEITKIVPDANARQFPGPSSAAGDQVVTQTLMLRNVGAAQLVPILRPLIPQYGHLAAHPASNMLIISDRGANVRRLMRIIDRIDQAGDEEIEVIPLQHASAAEVVRMLSALNQATQAAGGAPSMQIVADDRTNSVLIGGSKNGRLRMRALVSHLDTPTEDGGDTQVRYLNYADAEELATKLQTQFGGAAAGGQGGAAPGPAAEIQIWADEPTNALVVTAPPKLMRDMMVVVDKLDIRRAQVLVEAIIVEITDDRAAELGVSWAVDGSDGDNAIGLTNFGSTVPGIVQLATAAAGEVADPSVLPEGITLGVGRLRDDGTSFAAIISALAGDANTNIISTPTIVTMDNQEAEIKVGQEVPFLTGSFTNTGAAAGAVNPFQTIQREEVGTSLKITPQINEGSGVLLQIEQETSSISQGASGAVDLITNNRTISTSVFVEDTDVLVLGGLIDDTIRESEQRVPVLGNLPILGALFRARSTEKLKTNLMVFIKPTILRDGVQARFESNAKYNYIRDLQIEQGQRNIRLMREEQRPVLPELPAARPQTQTASEDPADQGEVTDDGS